MPTKSKKAAALILACFMVLMLFTGCGGNGSKTDEADNKDASTPASTGPVEVEWLAYSGYGQPDPEAEVIKQQEQWYNIKFNFWYVDQAQWDQILGVKLASGEMPDVMRVANPNMVEKYVKQGVIAPWTDDMLKKIPTIVKGVDTYGGKDLTVDGYYDGKLYVLKSVNLSGAYSTVSVWRTDWLKNAGINKMPETIKEYEDAMYKFRNDDPDRNGKKDTYGMSNTTITTVFGAYGQIPLSNFKSKGTQSLRWTIKNNKYVFACTQPEMKEALALLQKWFKDGVIDPEFITGENTGGYWAISQAFENGKIGVTGEGMSYHWNAPLFTGAKGGICYEDMIKVNPNAKFGETFDVGKSITGPSGKSGTVKWGPINSSGVSFTTKGVKDQRKVDAVLKMWNTISTDFDRYIYANFGVKDKHYTLDPASGQYTTTKEYSAVADAAKAGLGVTSTVIVPPDFLKKSNPLLYQFMDKYDGPSYAGYTDYPVPATDAAGKYLEDLKKLATDAYIQIITGTKPVEYFDDFVKTFNEKGGAEVEKQTNEAITTLKGK